MSGFFLFLVVSDGEPYIVEADGPEDAVDALRFDKGVDVAVWRLGRFPTRYAVTGKKPAALAERDRWEP